LIPEKTQSNGSPKPRKATRTQSASVPAK